MAQWVRIGLQCRRLRFDTWVGKILWRSAWQPTLVFLPRESHGQTSLAGYSPQGHKESDTTEVTEHTGTHVNKCRVLTIGYQGIPTHCTLNFLICSEKSGKCVFACMCAKSLESCPILCDPMDCSLPGSSVHEILQARILEWVVMFSSRGSSQCRH